MGHNQVIFDQNSKKDVLELFGKKVDKDGYIIEKKSKERVLTPEGEEIHIENFAGIKKGSEIFLKSQITSLINFVNRKK